MTNLTASAEPAALAAHVLDSLAIWPRVEGPLVDVGSGGGFPALVLAIAGVQPVLCIESVGKKAAFLREAARRLGLPVTVAAERAERAARDARYRGGFQSATARAVASAPAVAEMTVPFLRLGGVAVLQRGRMAAGERDQLEGAARLLGAALRGYEETAHGSVVVLEKIAETPERYPRKPGIPAKRPLG